MTRDLIFDLLLPFGIRKMSDISYSSKNIDHLGLVAGLCKDLKLAETLDSLLPAQSPQKKMTYGQSLVAMVLNGLGFTGRTLHMYPDYFSDKPVERLIGKGIESTHINDDALGRCLDALYENNVSDLYLKLGEKVIRHLGLPCESINIDATSFHVDGDYEVSDDFTGIQLKQGYSRDHRPDLNQVILNLITENKAGIPVYMQANSGNTNDMENFKQIVKSHITSLTSATKSRYLIGDSALYVEETIQSLHADGQFFITRVPQKIKAVKMLIKSQDELNFEYFTEGYQGCWYEANYGDVQQKWLIVQSEAAKNRELKTFNKRVHQSTEKSLKSFQKLSRELYTCEADATKALVKWKKQQKYINVENESIEIVYKHSQPGRPRQDEIGIAHYKITGDLASNLFVITEERKSLGIFVLASNDCSDELSMEKMLGEYKSQQKVEKGFRFLKSPDFLVSSIYIKKPERVEALLMVMTCCLMIYAALEHLIRTKLKEQDAYFPDMKNKDTQNPTARWVFQCFTGISVLYIDRCRTIIMNLKERHQTIISVLGPLYQKIYS